MKITTRAVYDMTDPRFWDSPEEALVEEESYEYEGDVALCSMHDGPTSGGGMGPSRGDGGLGAMSGGSEGATWGGDSASLAKAAAEAGVEHAGDLSTYDGRGNPLSHPSKLGGQWTTSYGVAQHARDNNMPIARASQQVAARDARARFNQRRAKETARAASLISQITKNIKSSTYSPQVQMSLVDSLQAGQLGDLAAAGVMSDAQARGLTDAYGGFTDQVARGLGWARDTPTDLDMPDEAYVDALTRGLINKDRSPTLKGLVSTYAPFATTMLSPVVGGLFSGLTSNPATQGILGLGFSKAGQLAAGMNSGANLGNYAGMANAGLGLAGIPGVPGLGLAATQAGTLGYMGEATAQPGQATSGGVPGPVGGSGFVASNYPTNPAAIAAGPAPAVQQPDLAANYANFMSNYYA
jgi:hypothetical protein